MAELKSRVLGKTRSQLMQVPAQNRRSALSAIKSDIPIEQIAPFIESLAPYPYFRTLYAPDSAPKRFAQLRQEPLLKRCSLERELLWTASVLKMFEAELTQFVSLERRFADAWMIGEFDAAGKLLDEVDRRFGKSGWLIERNLALLQERDGLDSQKAYSYSIRLDDTATSWAKFYAFNYSMRMEPAVSTASYMRMIEGQSAKAEVEDFRFYIMSRLLPDSETPVAALNGILGWDENAPVVDRYLTFLKVGQTLCVSALSNSQPSESHKFAEAIRVSDLSVQDHRLDNLRYAAAEPNHRPPSLCATTLSVFDDYAVGNYERSLSTARTLIAQHASRADLYEIYVKSTLQLGRRPDAWPSGAPISRLLAAYENVIIRSGQYVESIESLQKLALVANDPILSAHVAHLLGRERLRDELASKTEVVANITAPVGNPWQLTTFNALSPTKNGGSKLFEKLSSSPALRLQAASNSVKADYEQTLASPIFLEIPEYRKDFYSARILERHSRLEEASELYERWLGSKYPPLYFDSVLRLTWVKLLTKAHKEVLQLIVRTYLRSPFAYASMPVAEVLDAVQVAGPPQFADTPALAIVHDIYFKHISTSLDGERSDAFEDYLTSLGLSRPSQLKEVIANSTGTARDILIYYLRYICVPRIMDRSTAFEGTTDLLTERISICQLLAEVDRTNATAYTDEIRSTTQELVVTEGVRQVEQSRIYVDTDSIREYIEKPLSESYARYTQLPPLDATAPNRRIVLKEVGEVVSESKRGVLYVPLDERTAFLNTLAEQFGSQFVMNPRHGLSAYLSGRIRHGILPNHLRSPLQLAQLATLKDSRTGNYHPNEYWVKQLPLLDGETGRELGARLALFTRQIDEQIDLINQKWIQIKRPNIPEGLFDFVYSTQDLAELESKVGSARDYDEFLEIMFQFFWEFTERSLARVRQRIDDNLKPSIVRAFDELEADLAALMGGVNFSELDAAITKARTDMLGTLEAVKEWFRLSKAAEKPDFDLSTLLEIAIRSTNNIFKYSQLTPRTNLSAAMRLKGSTLTSLVELLCLLLSNIVLRSGVVGRSPATVMDVCVSPDGWLQFVVLNEVHFDSEKDRDEAHKSIEDVKELMSRNDPASFLDRNRGTGYARVQKILTHDLKCEHRIEFGLIGSEQFKVVVELDPSNLKVSI